jgi:hypothetical protein
LTAFIDRPLPQGRHRNLRRRQELHGSAAADPRLPEHNQWQVQHQLMVTKADIADVYVFDGAEGVIFPVAPDPTSWLRICAAWDAFARFVTEAQAPPLTDRDTRIRDDPEWLDAAARYVELRTASDELSAKCDEAKARLVGLASHAKEQGGGVSVMRLWKRGVIDYKRVPELAGLNLEMHRSCPREETRVAFDH